MGIHKKYGGSIVPLAIGFGVAAAGIVAWPYAKLLDRTLVCVPDADSTAGPSNLTLSFRYKTLPLQDEVVMSSTQEGLSPVGNGEFRGMAIISESYAQGRGLNLGYLVFHQSNMTCHGYIVRGSEVESHFAPYAVWNSKIIPELRADSATLEPSN